MKESRMERINFSRSSGAADEKSTYLFCSLLAPLDRKETNRGGPQKYTAIDEIVRFITKNLRVFKYTILIF